MLSAIGKLIMRLLYDLPRHVAMEGVKRLVERNEEPPPPSFGTAAASPVEVPPLVVPNNVTRTCWLCRNPVATCAEADEPVVCISCRDKAHPNQPRG